MTTEQRGRKVKGHLTLSFSNTKEDDDEEDSEDDEDDPWLDYGDTESGGGRVKSKRPKISKVKIVDSQGKQHSCSGRFPLTHSFWTVTTKVYNNWLKSPPAYAIYPSTQQTAYDVMLLLDDCFKFKEEKIDVTTANATKACFEAFSMQRKNAEALCLVNLETLLQSYMKQEAQGCYFVKNPQKNVWKCPPENHGLYLNSAFFKSDLGATALRAVSHPDLVETVSKLLPFAFQGFFGKLEADLVGKAAAMAQQSPWEFGFRQIVVRKLRIKGVEASISNFEKGDFLPAMPETYRDALYVYEILKMDAKKWGHMYMPFRTLIKNCYVKTLRYKIYSEQRWKDALDYLRTHEVIVIEHFDQDENVFLKYNWQAEVDITAGVEEILKGYCSYNHDFDFDFSCSEFDQIRTDSDQVKALYSAAHLPITVLSGSGGCGKTTVVTTLLKHVCNREEERLQEENLASLATADTAGRNVCVCDANMDIVEQKETQTLPCCPNARSEACTSNEEYVVSVGIAKDIHQSNDIRVKKELVDEQLVLQSNRGTVDIAKDIHQRNDIRVKKELVDEQSVLQSNGGTSAERSTMADEIIEDDLKSALVSDLIKILKANKAKCSPEMEEFKQKLLLTAPTGKAARLLGCKASLTSATLHSIIMSWSRHKELVNLAGAVEEPKWKYADVEVLVVDECSLVSVRLFSTVLNTLLRHAQLHKIILLGDIKQLPSIEPGDFLQDIFRSLSQPGFSIQLTHNHRSESSLIVENAKRISHRQMPSINASKRFHFIEIVEDGGDCERDQAIRQLLLTNDMKSHVQSQFVAFRNLHCQAINELCCKHYNGHSTMKIKSGSSRKEVQDFRPGDKICLGKNGMVANNCEILTDYIKDHDEYKRHCQLAIKKKRGKREEKSKESSNSGRNVLTAAETTSLFLGDEDVLEQTVTDMKEQDDVFQRERRERIKRAAEKSRAWKLKRVDGEKKPSAKEAPGKQSSLFKNEDKLCNGEVFFIMDAQTTVNNDGQATEYFILSDRDPHLPNVVCVSEKILRRKCKMKHSWARTIHTYQGSESDTVIYVVGTAVPQNWQHVYTAVTRGKKSVYMVSKPSQLQIAVDRRDIPRHSRLCERLKEMLLDTSDTLNVSKSNLLQNLSQTVTSSQERKLHNYSSFGKEQDESLLCSLPDPVLNLSPSLKGQGSAQNLLPESGNKRGNSVFGGGSNGSSSSICKISPPATPPRNEVVHYKRPSPGTSSCHDQLKSPPKLRRQEGDRNVDGTPFRESFSQTLSLGNEQNRDKKGEDLLPTKESVRKKL